MGVTENLLARIDQLKKELSKKDAIIDWLAEKACQCAEASKQGGYCSYAGENVLSVFKIETCRHLMIGARLRSVLYAK